jgi:ATP-dependent exoDNAse (exonuclease V) beta subunit
MSDPGAADADAVARERALDVTTSFVVQAPAGSGKTTVLTQRYLRLLAEVEEPEQVLAITFTRKAAGEMRERVRQALDAATEGRAPRTPAEGLTFELAARARAHAERLRWGIDESAARLRIQTIDSFNSYLAHSLPITSRSGMSRGVTEEPMDLYREAARETLRFAEADETLRPDLERVLRRLDDNWQRLETLIADMFGRRAEWLPNLPQLSGRELIPLIEAGLGEVVSGELTAAAVEIGPEFTAHAIEFARFIAPYADAARLPEILPWRDAPATLPVTLDELPRWRGLVALALKKDGGVRGQLTKREGIAVDEPHVRERRDAWLETLAALAPHRLNALLQIRGLPDPQIPERERRALDSLARLLLVSATQLTALFNRFGECDYPEIAGAARRALTIDSSPTPLAERLGTRLQHILVDEFQDTSREQYDLLLTLTQDWSTGDGRTLFLVGDPMQSIYGFRNAEVGRFSTVRDGGLGAVVLEALELRRNFRSAPALVHWCNDTFARVFPREDGALDSSVRHLASVAARDGLDGEAHVRRVVGNACARVEAQDVAARIAGLYRERPDESIAVLAGTRLQLRDVRRELKARNVPFVGVKLEPLADVAVVRDLESLARALEAPLDRIAWLAVLRAPFVGLTLPDLTAIGESARDGVVLDALVRGVPDLTPDGRERLTRALPVLVQAWSERELEPRAHLVERAWLALGGAAACMPAEIAHARRFLARLDAEDAQRARGRQADLGRLMLKLHAEDPAQPGAVSLMTVHGAKGLEFDHVFVVGVGRRGRPDSPRLLNWLELPRPRAADLLLMAPIRHRGGDDDEADAINDFLRRLLRNRAAAERARQAYVALTRARRSLHLYVHPRVRDAQAGDYAAESRTLLENLWPALGPDIAAFDQVGVFEGDEVAPAVSQARRRLPRRVELPAPPVDVLARGDVVQAEPAEEDIEFSWVRQTARRVGTVVHEELERLAGAVLPAAAEIESRAARLESRLRSLGVDAEGARAGAGRAVAALRATLADERGRWLFDPAHRDAYSELALSGLRGGSVVNAVIDRTFVDRDGTRWIVDFKTSPHEGGNLQGFLDDQARRYSAQMRRYAHLARALGPEPVRAGLYFPLLCAWREVDLDPRDVPQ